MLLMIFMHITDKKELKCDSFATTYWSVLLLSSFICKSHACFFFFFKEQLIKPFAHLMFRDFFAAFHFMLTGSADVVSLIIRRDVGSGHIGHGFSITLPNLVDFTSVRSLSPLY